MTDARAPAEIEPAPVAAAATDRDRREAVYRRIRWRIMPLLTAGFVAAQMDRVNIGFAKLGMQHDLGFDDAVYGLGAGVFFLGYFLFELPSNLVLARVGARRWLARIMMTWGAISALTLLVRTPTEFYIARFLLGVAEAGFAPGVVFYLAAWFPADMRGRATAMFAAGIPLAFIAGGPVSGWILQAAQGWGGLEPWQWLLLIEALPAVALGIAVLCLLDDGVGQATWLPEADRATVYADIAADNASKPVHGDLRTVLRMPATWLLSASFFCLIAGLYALGFWMPSLLRGSGVTDVSTIGWLVAVPYGVGLVAIVAAGRSVDRWGKPRLHFAAGMMLGAIGLAATALLPATPEAVLAGLTIAAVGLLGSVSVAFTLPNAVFAGAAAAAGIAIVNSIGNLAGFLSPLAIGRLNVATGHLSAGLYLAAAVVVVGAMVALCLRPLDVDR